jgi:hypothetical protein
MLHKLKLRIKGVASSQRVMKPLRKTVHFKGERYTIEGVYLSAYNATALVTDNKQWLRSAYIAYGELRGKTYEQIETNPKTVYNRRAVDKIKEEYAPIENSQEITQAGVEES